jgi:hypothetical protein
MGIHFYCSVGHQTNLLRIDDDDVYLKDITMRGITKSDPTQKCRPAKGIGKREKKTKNKRYLHIQLRLRGPRGDTLEIGVRGKG